MLYFWNTVWTLNTHFLCPITFTDSLFLLTYEKQKNLIPTLRILIMINTLKKYGWIAFVWIPNHFGILQTKLSKVHSLYSKSRLVSFPCRKTSKNSTTKLYSYYPCGQKIGRLRKLKPIRIPCGHPCLANRVQIYKPSDRSRKFRVSPGVYEHGLLTVDFIPIIAGYVSNVLYHVHAAVSNPYRNFFSFQTSDFRSPCKPSGIST